MIFKDWLYQKPNGWDDITNKQIIDHLYSVLLKWINDQNELLITIEPDIFKVRFYIFMYHKNDNINYYSDYEYFNLKYSDDVVDLFLEYKEITKGYGSMLLYDKEDNSNNLLDFLHNYCEIIEEEESIDDDNYEEEININIWNKI